MSCPPLPLTELSAAFRQRGELVARFAPGAAEAFACCAEWLEASLAAHLGEAITLQEAARESGWSYEGLRRRLHEDPSLNVGGPKAPLILRSELPRLGAPRGPRGPYGPRKPRPRHDAAAPADVPTGEEQEQLACCPEAEDAAQADSSHPGAAKTAAACVPIGDLAPPGTSEGTEVEPADLDHPAPRRVPESRGAAAGRKRRVPPPTRRRSTKERFTELLALAARP